MADSARVQSVEAIRSFRAALVEFGEEVQQALGAVDMQIRRALDWLQHDRLMYWQREIKRGHQAIMQARSDLHRKNLSRATGNVPDVSVEKEALRLAQHRLREAEQKVERVRKWVPAFQHAVAEYQGQARPLGDMMSGDLARSLALLDRMLSALDAYLTTAPPTTSRRDLAAIAGAAATAGSPTAATATATAATTAATAPPAEPAPATAPPEPESPAEAPPDDAPARPGAEPTDDH
jgi:hypothetical protein